MSSDSDLPPEDLPPEDLPPEARARVEELTHRAEDAEEMLRAIRAGEVDALVVGAGETSRVYTLQGADHAYRVLLEAMSEGAVTLSATGTILYANLRFAGMVGVPHERVIGTSFASFVNTPDQRGFCDLLGQDRPCRADLALCGPQGTLVLCVVSMSPVAIGGVPSAWAVVATDVTLERRRAQEALHASEARFQTLMDALPVGVSFSDDASCQRITGNPSVLAQFEVRLEDNLSASAPDPSDPGRQVRFHQRGRQITDAELPLQRAVAENRVIPSMELEVELPGGRRWIAEASGAPVRNAQGQVTAGIAVTVDITERKRAEECLRESEARFRAVLDSSRDVIYRLNVQSGHYEYISPSAEAVVGFSPDELMALDSAASAAMVHPDDAPAMRAAVAAAERTGRAEVEYRQRTRSGDYRWLSNHMALVRDDSGRPLYRHGNIRDITERKAIEQERERHLAQIEEANEAKDLFFNTLSHELRTPLAAMLNAVEVLKRPELTKSHRSRSLGILERNVRHQTRLIEDLLDVSRIMRKKVEIAHDPLDLREVVSAQIEAVEGALRAGQLALEVEAPSDPVPILGDTVRLGQVISNLLTNAVKFTGAGGRIRVQVAREDGAAAVRVTDTGMGIAPEMLPHIFEPFRQAETSLARSKGGLGIGLAVARSLAELHGGRLEAQSKGLDHGSEFTLRVPLRAGGQPTQGLSASKIQAADERKRVLVIEDNPDLRESLHILLEVMGYPVISATDGTSGVELARRERPDVALVDIGLPDLDGYQVAGILRSDPALKGTHLIALTGYATPEHRERALTAGFNQHLAKPVDAQDLVHALTGAERPKLS